MSSSFRFLVKASKANISSVRHFSNLPNITFSRLSNGLGVLSVEKNSALTTLGVSFQAGSAFETRATNGVSSILQNSLFVTSDDPVTSSLSREQFAFYGYADPGKEKNLLSKLNSSIPFNLTNDTFEGAQSLAISNLGSTAGGFENLANHIHTVAYQDGPHGLPLHGSVDSLAGLTLDKAHTYAEQHFVASRGVVTSVGPLKHAQLETLANEVFGRLPAGVSRPSWSPHTGSIVKIADDNRNDTEMLFGYGGPGISDEEHHAVQLITHLTGEWSKYKNGGHGSVSRLVDELVHDKIGLEMKSFYFPYAQLGLFGVYLHANYDINVREILPKGVLHYYIKLSQYLTDNEVKRGKAKSTNAYLKRFNSSKRSFLETSQEVHALGEPRKIEDTLNRIQSLTTANVKQIVEKFTYDVDVSVAASGQLYQFPDYNFLRNWTFWYRL